jgi:ABC-2 type transport system permease protein
VSGFMALTHKELQEAVRTYRLLVVSAVFLVSGLSGPLLTYYLPDIIRSGTNNQNIHITVGKQTALDAITSYVGSATQLPMLVVILVAMGAIADERRSGVAFLILYRPISRAAYLLAKATVAGVVVLTGVALGAAAAFYYTALLFTGAELGPFVLVNVGMLVIGLDVLALTLLCSALLKNNVAAGGAALVLYVLYTTLPPFWHSLAERLPTAISAHTQDLMSGTWTASDLVQPVLGGLVVAAVALLGAYWSLQTQEV